MGKIMGVHQAMNLSVNPSNAGDYILEFFYGEKVYVEAFRKIMDEMVSCEPDTLVFFDRGIVSLGKQNGGIYVYITPIPGAYEIKFCCKDEKEIFNPECIKSYLKECEKCVFHIFGNDEGGDETVVELKDVLNISQRRFCKIPQHKNVRLLAPAGSGKTYSILWRCKCIYDECLKKGKPIPRFLILTFTKSAAAELELRISENDVFKDIRANVRTLNSWGWEQNRKVGKELIISKFERRGLVLHDLLPLVQKNVLVNKALSVPGRKNKNADIIIDLMDGLKALGFEHTMKKSEYNAQKKVLKDLGLSKLLHDLYVALFLTGGVNVNDKKQFEIAETEFFDFWKKATVRLEENNRFTLEDQKYWARQYLLEKIEKKNFPKGTTKYTHLFIDEFQDVNPLDIALLNSISIFNGAGKHISLTVVGDDDQAIFGWRGTSPQYILNPEKYFSVNFDTCVLEVNYRSPNIIVNYAKTLIDHNKEREAKNMKSVGRGKAIVKLINKQRISPIDSTMQLIHSLMDEGCQQIALIGRKQAAIFPYQVLLSSEKIPYNVEADIDIFEGEAMNSLQEIIKIIYRAKLEDNDDPVEEVLSVLDKVNKYPLKRADRLQLTNYLQQQGVETYEEAICKLRECKDKVIGIQMDKLCNAAEKLVESSTVHEFMCCIEQDFEGLDKDYNKADRDNHYKEPQFFRLTKLSQKYGDDFRRFYRDIDRARKQGELSRVRNNTGSGNGYLADTEIPIHLLTATRSKGHEFDAVIILEANDSEWPSKLADNIEEERRLFYVAMTRAKKYLYFITSKEDGVSRFISEAGIQ